MATRRSYLDKVQTVTTQNCFRLSIGLSKESSKPGEDYDPFNVEILHEPDSGWDGEKMDPKSIFLNPILIKVLASILFGTSSVIAVAEGRNPQTASHVSTSASIWRVSRTTPGAIALASIVARWALSPDKEFRPEGCESQINWADEFQLYLSFLHTGHEQKDENVLNIFRVWDRALFPTYAARHHPEDEGDLQPSQPKKTLKDIQKQALAALKDNREVGASGNRQETSEAV